MWSLQVVAVLGLLSVVLGHGRLHDPPGRSTAWRHGFPTPVNQNDHELNCGAFGRQWVQNGGKCGICGDPWDASPREHESGGKYASGTIVRTYKSGAVIDTYVHLTTNHKGWFEFRVCPNNNIHKAATHACLDQNLLQLADGSGTRLTILPGQEHLNIKLKLPQGLTCEQCVFQWKYNTGNSWGTDPETGESGSGLGPQEQFYGCADVTIKA